MGEIICVTCKSCDFSREASVGVGMTGAGAELCPCYQCRRFVLKKVDDRHANETVNLKCSYCRKSVSPVEKGDRCAVCGGQIDVESIGLWD